MTKHNAIDRALKLKYFFVHHSQIVFFDDLFGY